MKRILSYELCILIAVAGGVRAQQQQQQQQPQQETSRRAEVPDQGVPVFRVNVVSRSVNVINYNHRQGSTPLDLAGTALAPRASGRVRVDSKTGATKVDIAAEKLPPPMSLGSEFLTYVVWAITPEGRPENLGELQVEGGDHARVQAATELQSFGLIVTAEPYFAVTQPSDVIVMEARVSNGTTGTISPISVKYELWPRGMYDSRLPEAERVWNRKTYREAPSAVAQAKHAIAIARSFGADNYARDTMVKADVDMRNAEDLFNHKGDTKRIQSLARNAAQLAEDARLISLRRSEEESLEAERKAAADRLAAARTEAEQEARKRELAESESRLAREREQFAKMRAEQEERERQRLQAQKAEIEAEAQRARALAADAETARQQALAEQAKLRAEQERLRVEAERARAEAESSNEARLKAERDRAALREQLRIQLNAILETRETARGLIVNMSDVLFATAEHSLKPGAREKLSKISGIVLAHPGLKLEVEGHTDSIGGDEYNQGLSERRASSVRDYLVAQGVPADSITARGFGKQRPVADNATAAGRQLNRRVELVVSGDLIGPAGSVTPNMADRR